MILRAHFYQGFVINTLLYHSDHVLTATDILEDTRS